METRIPKSMHVLAQRNVTDAQPHASFGSGPLFPSPADDILDMTGEDQASCPLWLFYDRAPML